MSDEMPPDEPAFPTPEQPALAPPSARHDSWWGVGLVLLTLLAIVGAIVMAWRPIGLKEATPAERYLPLSHGLALSYRVTHPDGTVTYQSSNTGRRRGNSALNELPIETQVMLMSQQTGIAPSDVTPELYGEFLRTGAASIILARTVDTDYDPTGAFTATESLLLLRPEQVAILSVNAQTFDPPLPVFDTALAIDASRTITGTVSDTAGNTIGYTATLTLEASERVEAPIGQVDDCRRTFLELSFGVGSAETRTWYCAGLGVVRQEQGSGDQLTRYELVGSNAPARAASVEQAPVLNPTVGATIPPGSVPALPEALEPIWSFREQGFDTHITSPPLAAGDLLIYGTQNGGLLAVDRALHTLRWRFQTGGGIYGAPTVADGVVFVGSTDRNLYALDLANGSFRWSFATRDSVSASPAVSGDLVYIASEDRALYAVDRTTGRERWRFGTSDAIATTPTVVDGTLYVGSDDGALYALDPATGDIRWAFATDDAIGGAARVADGVVYVGSRDRHLYALRADTDREEGELLWSYDAGDDILSDPALGKDTIYIATSDDQLRAVDIHTGQERWRYASTTTLYGAPLLAGDRVFINRGETLLVFDAATGILLEEIETGNPSSYHSVSSDGREIFVGHRIGFLQVFGEAGLQPWEPEPIWRSTALDDLLFAAEETLNAPPVFDGERLVFVTISGQIYAVATADGKPELLGAIENLGLILTQPLLAGDLLVVSDQDGQLAAFDVRTGTERWRAELGGQTPYPLALSGDRVLTAASTEGAVVARALDIASGQEVWSRELPSQYQIGAGAMLVNGTYCVAAGVLSGLDPASGEIRWQTDDSYIPIRLSAAGDRVYALGFNTMGDSVLVGINAATGEEQTSTQLALETFPARQGGMAAGDDVVLLALNNQVLVAASPDQGGERWRVQLPAGIAGAPVITGDAALLITLDNRLLAYALEDGRMLGDFTLQSAGSVSLLSGMSPFIVDQKLYAGFYHSAFALRMR